MANARDEARRAKRAQHATDAESRRRLQHVRWTSSLRFLLPFLFSLLQKVLKLSRQPVISDAGLMGLKSNKHFRWASAGSQRDQSEDSVSEDTVGSDPFEQHVRRRMHETPSHDVCERTVRPLYLVNNVGRPLIQQAHRIHSGGASNSTVRPSDLGAGLVGCGCNEDRRDQARHDTTFPFHIAAAHGAELYY